MTAKRVLMAAFLCVIASIAALPQSAEKPLTNQSIVKLVKAGFKEKTIITIISSRPSRFDLSTDQMIDLKRAGVREKIIMAMLARQQGVEFDGENWENDTLFDPGNTKASDANRPANPTDSSNGVFGSSSGSRANNETRGTKGSKQDNTITTGTASARIVRQPTETGTTPKLERVATLTNESVVELVEAGFSEGSIIRRIEQSPVDFDFSAPKLTELRKHRVTEKIITAMKIAAGEPTETNSSGSNLKRGS
jgi:hypothetical protein